MHVAPETVPVFLAVSHHFLPVCTQEGAERLADSPNGHSYLLRPELPNGIGIRSLPWRSYVHRPEPVSQPLGR